MRTRYVALVVAVFGMFPIAGQAQIKVDMSRVTCGDWLGYSSENREFIRYWMSGYYSAAANTAVLDVNRLQKNTAKLAAYCKKHKPDSLPTAIKKAIT